ncbi:hypothetical protein [Nocardia carnea]|uniref:hypothetical protein n=1 Tax=Nocardia carnea TaxID=37328 RepID=UPI0024561494|nr:hypothetical protein [Nocardia carnea]
MRFGRLLAVFAGILSATAIFSIVLSVIWPGEIELIAPLFCADPYNDPMVVSDTYHDSEGTSTNFTLYCVGDRGQFTNEGFFLPWLVLVAAHTGIVVVPALLIGIANRGREPRDAEPRDRESQDAAPQDSKITGTEW